MPQTKPVFDQIDTWLQEVASVKAASTKKSPKSNSTKAPSVKKAAPDGVGESEHVTEDVDDGTQPVEEGARAKENTEDVKADVPGVSVDATTEGGGGTQDDKQMHIGMNPSTVGEDPSVENDYKDKKEDPGSDHPAVADEGEKYSSMDIGKLLKKAEFLANDILADLAKGIENPTPTQAAPKKAAQAPKVAEAPKANPAPVNPAPASNLFGDFDKIAAEYVEQAINDADFDADLVGSYVHSYSAGLKKKAEDEPSEEESTGEEGGGGEGEEGGVPPGDLLSQLGGGGEGGGMPPMGGGDPSGGMMPPDAGGGGMGGGLGGDMGSGMGGPGGGGMHEQQALQELAMALQELGISPEELAQLAQSSGAAQGNKLASAVKDFKRNGKFRLEETKTAAQRIARDQIKDYIKELVKI